MALKDPRELAQVLTITNPQAAINGGTPTIQAKPQRFTHSPRLEDYGLSYEEGPYKEFKDEYYYSRPKNVDEELEHIKGKLATNPNDEFYAKRLNILSNDKLQKYLRDSDAFNKQITKDYDEYYPTAKKAIIDKILGDGDLYKVERWNKDLLEETDDLYDSINNDFNKKYGYDGTWGGGDWFSPARKRGSLFTALGNEERDENRKLNGRRKYNKAAYLGDLLSSGELSIDDLKRYILGK